MVKHFLYNTLLLTTVFVLLLSAVRAQKPHISLKDSVDGAFDLSNYIIYANGFVPIPYIITEPSLGGFGLALAPVFIKKRPPYVDSIRGRRVLTPVAPDVTGAVGAYTVNNTWIAGAFRSGTWEKMRVKYLAFVGYANVNMAFYHTFPQLGEKKFEFNGKVVPIVLQGTKRLGYSHWYAGLKYMYLHTDLKYTGDPLLPIDWVGSKEFNSLVSQLGAVLELDNRDNTFTPNSGMKLHFDANMSDQVFGSDYYFWHLNYYMYAYKTFWHQLTGGWRVDGQQSFGTQPFYVEPYIDMRGVPAERYQGDADILTELELRWDFVHRWSAVGFGGTGKAFDSWSEFGPATWVVSGGVGFRYLLARKFGLRVGMDFARGPDTWAYYIVFGSNWLK